MQLRWLFKKNCLLIECDERIRDVIWRVRRDTRPELGARGEARVRINVLECICQTQVDKFAICVADSSETVGKITVCVRLFCHLRRSVDGPPSCFVHGLNLLLVLCIHTYIHTYIHTHTHTPSSTHTCIRTYVHACRQTDRQKDRQTDRQTDIHRQT